MITAVLLLFFISVLLVFYSYVVFPAILALLSSGKFKKVDNSADDAPFVSILMSVYNEDKIIAQKLKGLLDSDYPSDRMDIIIGSDCSTDKTEEIIIGLASLDKRIKLFVNNVRRGKPAIVNELINRSTAQLVILTDANVLFERDTIQKLVRNFSDPTIGLVGANCLNIGMRKQGISHQEKSYIERENLIKFREGQLWGTMMGAFGGCYALRKELYTTVPKNFLVDDFFISMKVLEKGFKCVNEMDAICYEDVSDDIRQEYRRKARISAGNFQNLKTFSGMLLRPFSPAGFCFISHKVLRWITPFLILITLGCLGYLGMHHTIYAYFLLAEICLLLTPILDWLLNGVGVHLRLLRFVSYFSYMNLALLQGFIRYAKGVNSGVWTPTKRNV